MTVNRVTDNMADAVAHWASEANSVDVASGTNAAAIVQYAAAGELLCHVVEGVAWSYGGQMAGARLLIEDGTSIVFDIDIPTQGWGYIPVSKRGSPNTAMTITLTAGGGGIVGKLNVLGHRVC